MASIYFHGIFYFYPRSPCGERPVSECCGIFLALFLSTLSLRRATSMRSKLGNTISISIHALLAESDVTVIGGTYANKISIHALLAESDFARICSPADGCISIHALLAESDGGILFWITFICPFLSTLSLRRATSLLNNCYHNGLYFYPRSPCGERLAKIRRGKAGAQFLSTLSLRRATDSP